MEILPSTSDEELFRRLRELTELNQPWQTEERRQQIKREIGRIIFEQIMRYSESHPEDSQDE